MIYLMAPSLFVELFVFGTIKLSLFVITHHLISQCLVSILTQAKITMPVTTMSFWEKSEEYRNSPLSPNSCAKRLQIRLDRVRRTFALPSSPPSSPLPSSSPSSASRRILVNQTISESSVTSPHDSRSDSSPECAKPIDPPDDGTLTEADIHKMLDDTSMDTLLQEDDAIPVTSCQDIDVSLDVDDVKVINTVSSWEHNSLRNTAPNKLIPGSYHGIQCKKNFIKSIGLVPVSKMKKVDDDPVAAFFNAIQKMNSQPKGSNTRTREKSLSRKPKRRSERLQKPFL